MNNQPEKHSVEFLYREYYHVLIEFIRRAFPYLSVQDAEDLIQALFEALQRRGTTILGNCSLESLKRHAVRLAIALIRARNAFKRGSGKVSSLDYAMEAFGLNLAKEGEPDQQLHLQAVQQLQMVDRVIEETMPRLSDRELILIRHIRRWAPVELSSDELRQELTPFERLVFLPVRRETTLEEAESYICRQISRSKSSLQEKLRETRDSLGF